MGGGLEEGGPGDRDSGKHASSVIEGGQRLKLPNVVRKGGGLEEGGAKNRDSGKHASSVIEGG